MKIPEKVLTDYYTEQGKGLSSTDPNIEAQLPSWMFSKEILETQPRKQTEDENSGEPIGEKEVCTVLKLAKRDKAPGSDGIQCEFYKLEMKLSISWLTKLFENLRVNGTYPKKWLGGLTTLIFKKGDPLLPCNWREICLLICLSKLYGSIMDKRLHALDLKIKQENPKTCIFSESQRGFKPNLEGCNANFLIVKALLANPTVRKKYLVFIDFAAAFPSAEHKLLILMMKWLNLPTYLINAVKAMYNGAYTRIKLPKGYSKAIPIERGVLQGATISPSLFSIILEILLRMLAIYEGIKLQNKLSNAVKVTNSAFADDLNLASESKKEMKEMIKIVETFGDVSNIALKVEKCVGFKMKSMNRNGKIYFKATDPSLKIEGKNLKPIFDKDTFKFLGHEVGGDNSPRNTFTRILSIVDTHLTKLKSVQIPAFLKRDVWEMFIIPKVKYLLNVTSLAKNKLAFLDRIIRKFFKNFEGLPPCTSTNFCYLKKSQGGLQLTSLSDQGSQIAALCHVRLQEDRNQQLNAAKSSQSKLIFEFLSKTTNLPIEIKVFFEKTKRFQPSDLMVFINSLELNERKRIFKFDENFFAIHEGLDYCNVTLSNSFFPKMTIEGEKVTKKLFTKTFKKRYYEDLWLKMQDLIIQGSSFTNDEFVVGASCPWMTKPWFVKSEIRRFAIKAQLSLLNGQWNLHQWKLSPSPLCPYCQNDSPPKQVTETTIHILNHCPSRLPFMLDRHNEALKVLEKHLNDLHSSGKEEKQFMSKLTIDLSPDLSIINSNLRPDLIAIFDANSKNKAFVAVVDIKTPWPYNIAESNSRNLAHYDSILNSYKQIYPSSSLSTLPIPSVGPITSHSIIALNCLNIPSRSHAKLLRDMSMAMTTSNYRVQKTLRKPQKQSAS